MPAVLSLQHAPGPVQDVTDRDGPVADPRHEQRLKLPLRVGALAGLHGGVALAAGVISALIVRQRIDSLDLVAVLKTRE